MAIGDDEKIKITCPQCRRTINKSLRWFNRNGQACPGCDLGFKDPQSRRLFKKLEKEISGFAGSVGKIGK